MLVYDRHNKLIYIYINILYPFCPLNPKKSFCGCTKGKVPKGFLWHPYSRRPIPKHKPSTRIEVCRLFHPLDNIITLSPHRVQTTRVMSNFVFILMLCFTYIFTKRIETRREMDRARLTQNLFFPFPLKCFKNISFRLRTLFNGKH